MTSALWTTENGFNKADIMRAAWAEFRTAKARVISNYHPDDRAAKLAREWSICLRMAWNAAKKAKAKTEAAQIVAAIPAAERADRAAALTREAFRVEMLDRDGSKARQAFTMRAEANALLAA